MVCYSVSICSSIVADDALCRKRGSEIGSTRRYPQKSVGLPTSSGIILCTIAFDESAERNRHHYRSCKGDNTSTATCEVVKERTQGTYPESPALVFVMCIVLEFIICPIRVRGYSVDSDDSTGESVQECSSQK